MKKLIANTSQTTLNRLGTLFVCLALLIGAATMGFNVFQPKEAQAGTEWCDTTYPNSEEICKGPPTNCACPIIITPGGGPQGGGPQGTKDG
jgi:hypothetical protein